MSTTLTSYSYYTGCNSYLNRKTPKRYFNLGLFCCCLAGFVFILGLFLMVWGSSPFEPDAIYIAGIFFLFLGGFLFFLGIGSIGIYLAKEDERKREIERIRTRNYAASITSARSLRSSDLYLIDWDFMFNQHGASSSIYAHVNPMHHFTILLSITQILSIIFYNEIS